MNNIEILNYTQNPLTAIGLNSAICYNTEVKDEQHPMRIAKHCLTHDHGRNLEFADITLKITCSARCAREWYTHIGGSPTRVQASTRYITYDNFNYYTPRGLNKDQRGWYEFAMEILANIYKELKDTGAKNDLTGYILPLGMETTFIWKGNARTLENMFNQRLCYRALDEYRFLMKELKAKIANLDEEWKWISDSFFIPKCIKLGYCPEGKKDCKLYREKVYYGNNN